MIHSCVPLLKYRLICTYCSSSCTSVQYSRKKFNSFVKCEVVFSGKLSHKTRNTQFKNLWLEKLLNSCCLNDWHKCQVKGIQSHAALTRQKSGRCAEGWPAGERPVEYFINFNALRRSEVINAKSLLLFHDEYFAIYLGVCMLQLYSGGYRSKHFTLVCFILFYGHL